MSFISNNNLYSLIQPTNIDNSIFVKDTLNQLNTIKSQINQLINDNNKNKIILDKVEKDIKFLSSLNDSILIKFSHSKL
jgi:hypothetical protein